MRKVLFNNCSTQLNNNVYVKKHLKKDIKKDS